MSFVSVVSYPLYYIIEYYHFTSFSYEHDAYVLCHVFFLFSLRVTGKVNKSNKNPVVTSEPVWEWPIAGDISWTEPRAWHWTVMCIRFAWSWRLLLLLLDLHPQKTCQDQLVEPQRVPPGPRNARSSALASSQTRGRCFSTTRGVLLAASFIHSLLTRLTMLVSSPLTLSGHYDRIFRVFKALYNVFPS